VGVAPVFFVPAGVVAILAALTLHAFAQPASRPPNTPPPGSKIRAKTQRSVKCVGARSAARARAREHDAEFRQSGNDGAAEFGNPPGFGASRTGFVSTNIRRSIIPGPTHGSQADDRNDTSCTLAAPAVVDRAGHQLDRDLAALDRGRHFGPLECNTGSAEAATAKPVSATPAARSPRRLRPRNPLLRIPDGTTTAAWPEP